MLKLICMRSKHKSDTKLVDVTDQIPTQLACVTWRGRDKSRPYELRALESVLLDNRELLSLCALKWERVVFTVPKLV